MPNTNLTRKEIERLFKGKTVTNEERDREQGDGMAAGAGIDKKGMSNMTTVNKGGEET